ncbi:hypothetical protein CFPU101_47390 [Chroococcus sp. FPU101]|nr:hypothetical protein CFPU101_47390 [Chroococcus sp. FPU101]
MLSHEKVTRTRWQKFDRIFSSNKIEVHYIREIIFGHRTSLRYWEITTDQALLPPNSTWFLMTNKTGNIQKTVGNIYGLRTWIEYGFKQCKDELGWADYRLTSYEEIEKWWEIVMSAYMMVSFQSEVFQNLSSCSRMINSPSLLLKFQEHPWWNQHKGWKNLLNNLRLIIQPMVFCCLITPWLSVFPIPPLTQGFLRLIDLMNQFNAYVPDG